MKYVCTSLGMVFSHLSPLVHKRLSQSERNAKSQLKYQSQILIDEIRKKLANTNTSYFIPLKYALHVIDEGVEKGDINSRYINALIVEINAIHSKCDRLVTLRHENFSRGLTIGVTISFYTYFIAGSVTTHNFRTKHCFYKNYFRFATFILQWRAVNRFCYLPMLLFIYLYS